MEISPLRQDGVFIAMDRIKSFTYLHLLTLLAVLTCGCQPTDSANPSADNLSNGGAAVPTDGVPADQILTLMRAVYANAKNYRDDGVLLLSYRKDGLLTEEPQRWSTAWTADGRLAMEVFGAHLRGDGQRLSCYIYDIDTANLDGQRMVVPYQNRQPPVAGVFRDAIARVFLGGYSELPLNEVDESLREKLVPAPLSLLTGQLPCVWLQNPSGVERLADAKLGSHDCYVIRSLAEGLGCDVWIDKSSGLLLQMSLPLKLLDPQVMAAPNITDLQLLARFENASIDTAMDPKTFELQPRKNSTPVKSFVTLPQALPVESIGQVVDRFRLIQPDGKSVDHLHFDGKPTALLWLGGENSYDAIKSLTKLSERLPANQFNFGIIYSDSELEGTPAQPHLVRPALTAATASSDVPMFYDPRLAASIELAIRDIPSVVLLDGDSRVQFATSVVGDAWADDLAAAMRRVAAGENLGDEMLAQYQNFMTRYKTALTRVDATDLMPASRIEKTAAKTPSDTAWLKRDSPPKIRPRLRWVNREFTQAGNISVFSDGKNAQIAATLDGWRSVVLLELLKGKTIDRVELDLPEGVAVSRIRSTPNGKTHVLFSPGGKAIYLFDKTWQPLTTLPLSLYGQPDQIKDVQIYRRPRPDRDSAKFTPGKAALVVSTFNAGIIQIRLDQLDSGPKRVSRDFADAVTATSAEIAWITNGQAKKISRTDDDDVQATSDLRFQLQLISAIPSMPTPTWLTTGQDANRNWSAVQLDSSLVEQSMTPIGSQQFKSAIDPVTVDPRPMGGMGMENGLEGVCAIASSDLLVHVLDHAAQWLSDIRLNAPPTGVKLHRDGENVSVLIALPDRVECWALE